MAQPVTASHPSPAASTLRPEIEAAERIIALHETPRHKPTVSELERILQQPDAPQVSINPDGSISAGISDALTVARALLSRKKHPRDIACSFLEHEEDGNASDFVTIGQLRTVARAYLKSVVALERIWVASMADGTHDAGPAAYDALDAIFGIARGTLADFAGVEGSNLPVPKAEALDAGRGTGASGAAGDQATPPEQS